MTDAVRPAADDAFPEVYTARGMKPLTYLRNCDLAVEGSPTMHTLMSPRRFALVRVTLCTPPSSMRSTPFLTSSCPKTVGQMEDARREYRFGVFDICWQRSCVSLSTCDSNAE